MAVMGILPGDVVIALGFAAAAAMRMAATGVLPGDEVMALGFTATAAVVALMFGGGGVGVHNIVVCLERVESDITVRICR